MAMRTITHLFDSHSAAVQAVRDLEAAGFPHDDISLVGSNAENHYGAPATNAGAVSGDPATAAPSGAGTGASIGTVLGGGAGLLAGLGMLAIPGVGPVVAAGWLVATLTGAGAGAAAGGLLGGLTAAGVSEADAHVYAEGVRRGGHVVSLRADDARIAQAEAILVQHEPVDITRRGADYRSGGWTGYQESPVVPSVPDGTPGNPPGTATTRAVDRAAGTNMSGAYPQQSDGTPANPPGTAASRAVDRTIGTDISGANPSGTSRL